MDRTSLAPVGERLAVIDFNGQLKVLAEHERPVQGDLIVAAIENEPKNLQVKVATEEGSQDITQDVAQIIDALRAGQEPTLLSFEFAPASGENVGSSFQESGTVERTGAEILASTWFETMGIAALGLSETQSLSLAELLLSAANSDDALPAISPRPPVAKDDSVLTDEDASVSIDVLANDQDADSDSLRIESATVPAEQGTVEIIDGKLTFTPAKGFNGEATITYVVTDGALTDEATVTVTVNPVNDAPTIDVTAVDSVTEDAVSTDTVVATVTVADTDTPADELTVQLENNDDGYFVLDGDQVKLTDKGVEAVNNDQLDLNSLSVTASVSDGVNPKATDTDSLDVVR
ncbi:hypothetical protein JR728_003901, partial [Vibrio vulnificus]|nr:hypothetical protein [Vibrio vulnificus]